LRVIFDRAKMTAMAGKEIPLGPTGETVRANVTRYRTSAALSFAELSRRLEDAGRAIAPLGLRRIESGARRVDVDDLVALAVVLGVNPNALLMPEVIGTGLRRAVTGAGEVSTDAAWLWARGDAPPSHGSAPIHRMKLRGKRQLATPALVLTDDQRHRQRAQYVNERARAVQEARPRYPDAAGRNPVDSEEPPVSNEVFEEAGEVERLLGLDLTDDEAWSAEDYDPAPPPLRTTNDVHPRERSPKTTRDVQEEAASRERERSEALARSAKTGQLTRIRRPSKPTNG